MNRILVLALVASLGKASAVFAGESILTSGTRHVQQLATVESSSAAAAAIARTPAAGTVLTVGEKSTPSFQAEGGTVSKSGMGKGKKTMIYVGLAVAFAATVWTIDHNVLDITPSSLGTRQD